MTQRQDEMPLLLVADDEINTRIMLQRLFEREGFAIESAADGFEALQKAEELIPTLILLDIRMPEIDGFEVLRRLRQNPLTTNIPTILITANARTPQDVAAGLDLGADDYLFKPFAPQELVARVQSKIRARELEDALKQRSQELAALLRVGEELNKHLQTPELLELLPQLALDLLPGDIAAIYRLGEHGRIESYHLTAKDSYFEIDLQIDDDFVQAFMVGMQPLIWDEPPAFAANCRSAIAIPLQHSDNQLGLILLASKSDHYNKDEHLRLLSGIGKQASLALHNATLFEILASHADDLEEMVEERAAELKKAYNVLAQSEKLAAVGRLAASVAHEINNPLQPITITLSDIAEDVQNGYAVDSRSVEILQESVERIRRIVRRLLDFTRQRSTNSEFEIIDVSAVVQDIAELYRKAFDKDNLVINMELEPELYIQGDKSLMETVFINLTVNAQYAMKRGGELIIRTYQANDLVCIEFEDSGCGIASDLLEKIFEPFFTTKPEGTGLGLFVLSEVIHGHEGSITVDSTLDVGTTFTIQLPALR